MPVVTVQMAVPPPATKEGEVIGACSLAFSRGACVWREEAGEEAIRASVRGVEANAVEISVGQAGHERRLRLVFHSGDPDAERYKAIGYAIGSAARAVLEERERPALPAPVPTTPALPATAPPLALRVHVEPHLSSAPLGDYPTYGGGLGASAHIARGWVVLAAARLRTSHRASNGLLVWNVESLAGGGYGWLGRQLGFELRGGIALQWIHASIEAAPPRVSDDGNRTVVAGWVEGLLLIAPRNVVCPLVGAGFLVRSPTAIYVDAQPQRDLDSWELSVSLGLRIRIY